MVESATLLILPAREAIGEEIAAAEAMAPFLTENLEDLHLAGRVERALHATGHGTLRNIEVTVQVRAVTLAGRVPSYYLKQVAQTVALAVPGIHRIHNDLAVD